MDRLDGATVLSPEELERYARHIVLREVGGPGQAALKNARVPVVQHYKGVCHLFLDRGADVAIAEKIVLNAKMQRPGVRFRSF